MDIDNLTYKQLKEISSMFGNNPVKEKAETSGLSDLIGEQVTFFCLNYIYHGKVLSCDNGSVKITNPKIVYETGDFNENGFQDAQKLECSEFNIQIGIIESFGILRMKND